MNSCMASLDFMASWLHSQLHLSQASLRQQITRWIRCKAPKDEMFVGICWVNGCITWFYFNVYLKCFICSDIYIYTRKVGRQLTLQPWCSNLQSLTDSKVECWVGWAWRDDLASSVWVGSTFSRMFYSLGGQRMHQSCPQHCQHPLALRLMLVQLPCCLGPVED